MPYVQVPKDLAKIKTKVAFNLTKRQLICFSIAGATALPTYFFTRDAIGNMAAMILLIIVGLPGGNATIIEDVSADVVDRQFIAIQSKNGNTFYIVIDKDSNAPIQGSVFLTS